MSRFSPRIALRRSDRYRFLGAWGEIAYYDILGQRAWAQGALLDAGPRGFMLRMMGAVPESTPCVAQLRLADAIVRVAGVVRHCTTTPGGYKVGVELVFDAESE